MSVPTNVVEHHIQMNLSVTVPHVVDAVLLCAQKVRDQ